MKIKVTTDIASQLTTYSISGDLDFNELLDFIETHHSKTNHTTNCLWDFRSVTGGERVSVLQIGKFYGLCGKYFFHKSTHKISFVVGNELGFGFAQVMSTFEELYDVYLNIRVFKSIEDAICWLEEDST
jgi:hypothetical protein